MIQMNYKLKTKQLSTEFALTKIMMTNVRLLLVADIKKTVEKINNQDRDSFSLRFHHIPFWD